MNEKKVHGSDEASTIGDVHLSKDGPCGPARAAPRRPARAPRGLVWVCGTCGTRSHDREGKDLIDQEPWDEACTKDAKLAYADSVIRGQNAAGQPEGLANYERPHWRVRLADGKWVLVLFGTDCVTPSRRFATEFTKLGAAKAARRRAGEGKLVRVRRRKAVVAESESASPQPLPPHDAGS